MVYDYNEISKIYDDVRESDLKMISFMLEISNLNSKEKMSKEKYRILEIGCGTGNNLKVIEQLSDAELWGIDCSVGMLKKAKEKCKDAFLFEDDATRLENLSRDMFDLVFMVDVIHHIKDIDSMIKNIKRVLKPNGHVVVFSDSHEHIKQRLTTKYFPETLQAELDRYQDTDEIKNCLLKQNFNDVHSGAVQLGITTGFGQKLIDIATKKGYSMFGLITDEAIAAGIDRIKEDMKKHDIEYHQSAPYVLGAKEA